MDKKLKTIDIKGKEYVTVNERIRAFRELYEDGKILTSIYELTDKRVIFRAEIYVNDKLIANGTAYEDYGSTFINKTSFIENAETSAIGRALGIAGIGVDTSIASFEEVANAILNQDNSKKQKQNKIAELQSETDITEPPPIATDVFDNLKATLEACDSLDSLQSFADNMKTIEIPKAQKVILSTLYNQIKARFLNA